MIRRTSEVSRFITYKFSDVLRLISIVEKVVSKGDDFIIDVLFYFEPVWRFVYRGDMFSFRGSSFCASKVVVQ